eukprot:3495305-Alexandrium_andersonii.AAC.1
MCIRDRACFGGVMRTSLPTTAQDRAMQFFGQFGAALGAFKHSQPVAESARRRPLLHTVVEQCSALGAARGFEEVPRCGREGSEEVP